MNKKYNISIIYLVIVLITYILTRFIFFNVHGMKEFPNTMILLSGALTCLFILSNNYVAATCSSLGNLLSFFIGMMFHKSYVDVITGNNDNFWLIWLVSYIIVVILGMVIGKMFHVKHRN